MSDKPLKLFKNLSKCEVCGNVYSNKEYTGCPTCFGIHFDKIRCVKKLDSEPHYETREEFECDFLKSDFYSSLDGHNHYEGEWIENEVENGELITFEIDYDNDDYDIVTLSSYLPVTKRLLHLSHKNKK